MHFLCLHGVGTNSKILELQTSAIRYALGPQHTFDFVEGAIDHPMAPGIAHLVSPTDTFHAYFAPTSGLSMLSALRDLEALVADAEPAYDGVLGFSHGSCLAATLLLMPGAPSFKVAVFFSAGMAADHSALQADVVTMLQQQHGGATIDIPTAHVFAENDEVAPGQGQLLVGLCAARGRHVATHGLGHQIPGAAERGDLENAVRVIREAIADAEK
ncbi:serine hydrolase FSH [Aspergillus lucknowensis]|uniref:Serine hydrolase FSH n=1 Tax=Aspergillus lucknowensis TaxID=176173 RepID=A0ABR4M4S7_9EURO